MNIDKGGNDLDSNEVFRVREGIFNMWVCAPKSLTRDEVQAAVDQQMPAGTFHGWQVEEEANDDPHMCSPGRCAEDENRQHWNCKC